MELKKMETDSKSWLWAYLKFLAQEKCVIIYTDTEDPRLLHYITDKT